MKAPMLANWMMPGVISCHDLLVDAHERTREGDVLATGQLGVEAGIEGEQRGDMTVDLDHALCRLEDAREGQQRRRLARAVGTDDADGLAAADGQVHTAQRPEVAGVAASRVEQVGEGRAQLRLLGEVEVVAHAQVLRADGDVAEGYLRP